MKRIAIFFACAFALFASAAALRPARAQSDESNAQFWLQERALQQRERAPRLQAPPRNVLYQRPTHLIRRARPVPGFTRSEPPPAQTASPAPANGSPVSSGPQAPTAPGAAPAMTPASGAPSVAGQPPPSAGAAQSAAPAAAAQAGPKPTVAPGQTFTVAVIGDSLGQFLEEGLSDFYADRPDIVLLRRARESTGLVRDDYYDWVRAAKELADGSQHIDMAIMMVGSNDHQPIVERSGVYESLSPQWRQIYEARAEAIAAAFRDKKIPFLWVGAPIMKSPSLSDAMLAFNDIYKEAAEKEGATYLDVWDLFADESGRYALYGPDVNGDTAKLRSGDGVHFTREGARKLAQFVATDIQQVIDGTKPAVNPAIAGIAPQVAPAEPMTRAPLAPPAAREGASKERISGDLRALIPAPAAPIQPVIPIRPAAGPVVALTTPVVAPDGQLVTKALVQTSAEGESVEQLMNEGAPIQSRPGRADDFRWPRD